MKYTNEILKDKHYKFEISLSKEEWEEQLEKAYDKTKGKYKVQGFRSGKVPRKVIEKNYGDTIFYDEAINNAFYDYYNQVLTESKVEPVGTPKLDVKKIDENGIVLVITTAVMPEVKLGEYKGLTIEKTEVKVSVAEVNAELQNMQEKSARLVKVDRELKDGDTAVIDFVGKKDGVAFDGGTAKGYELVIGSKTFIPGFEEQLVGMKTGETKVINVTFPESYQEPSLAGKPTTFDVTLNEVREKVVPELDDDFAKNVSEFDTLEEYKKDIKKQIKLSKDLKAGQEAEAKLLEKITDNAEIDMPEELVDEQVDAYIHDFEHRLSHNGLKLEDYVKYMNTTVEQLKLDRREDAKKTAKMRLVLEQIMKAENITVEKEDFDKEIARQAVNSGVDVEEFKKSLNDHILGHIANDILISKLLEFLKNNNNL